MVHKYVHEVDVGTKWAKKAAPMAAFFDKEGWVTHTVVIGSDVNPEGHDDPCTFVPTDDWPTILEACGFCSKSEARRRGFEGKVSEGYTERRVASNMVLSVWNMKPKKQTNPRVFSIKTNISRAIKQAGF